MHSCPYMYISVYMMFIYICMFLCVFMYMCIYLCIHSHTHACVPAHIYVCVVHRSLCSQRLLANPVTERRELYGRRGRRAAQLKLQQGGRRETQHVLDRFISRGGKASSAHVKSKGKQKDLRPYKGADLIIKRRRRNDGDKKSFSFEEL